MLARSFLALCFVTLCWSSPVPDAGTVVPSIPASNASLFQSAALAGSTTGFAPPSQPMKVAAPVPTPAAVAVKPATLTPPTPPPSTNVASVPATQRPSVWDQIKSNPNFSMFVTFVESVYPEMSTILSEKPDEQPFTLFAPNNEAFATLHPTWAKYEPNNQSTALQFLQAVLLYHLLPEVNTAESFTAPEETLQSRLEPFLMKASRKEDVLYINDAKVVMANQYGRRSVWHGIDKIISPLFFLDSSVYQVDPADIDGAAEVAKELSKLPPQELEKLMATVNSQLNSNGQQKPATLAPAPTVSTQTSASPAASSVQPAAPIMVSSVANSASPAAAASVQPAAPAMTPPMIQSRL